MRKSVLVDETLAMKAMKIANVQTIDEAIDIALRRYVQGARQRRLIELKGTGGIREDYDSDRARGGR